MRLMGLLLTLSLGGCALFKPGAQPIDIVCPQATLSKYEVAYAPVPQFAEIQRDSGHDFDPLPAAPLSALVESEGLGAGAAHDPIYDALKLRAENLMRPESMVRHPVNVLILSGGGAWGAFGAGFMRQLRADGKLPEFDLVTGVSTGALQALFVSAQQYDALQAAYASDTPLAKDVGFWGALQKGYLADTGPLRDVLEANLCIGRAGPCPLRDGIIASRTLTYVGMVELRTGAFKAINVGGMLRDADRVAGPGHAAALDAASRCVAAVTLASAAVPVQLRPVRLRDGDTQRYRAYADGGVRLSVFDAHIADIAGRLDEEFVKKAGSQRGSVVDTYVIRNGPTVVPPQRDDAVTGMSGIDTKPSADRVALMAYRTLVNQNEVMSIAGLRLFNPAGKIFVATADGFATPSPWRKSPICPPVDTDIGAKDPAGGSVFFNRPFMRCLVKWGGDKAANHPRPWIILSPIPATDKAGTTPPRRLPPIFDDPAPPFKQIH